jgi:hypothetical protein
MSQLPKKFNNQLPLVTRIKPPIPKRPRELQPTFKLRDILHSSVSSKISDSVGCVASDIVML